MDGCPAAIQIVSETTTESVASGARPAAGVARDGGGQAGREVGAADLLFQLPEELDVGAHAVLDRQPRAVERGQRRSLVVGGAAREPARGPPPLGRA